MSEGDAFDSAAFFRALGEDVHRVLELHCCWAAHNLTTKALQGPGHARRVVVVAVSGCLDRPQMESASGHRKLNVDCLSWAPSAGRLPT